MALKPIIQILIDNPNSWIVPHVQKWTQELISLGYNTRLIHRHDEVAVGDVLLMLSCEKKFKDLSKNKFNLVVHGSSLPQGKGWSPMTWLVLEGKSQIPITLFEAQESIDSGAIYEQIVLPLKGDELVQELRDLQFNGTRQVFNAFLSHYPNVKGLPQHGESSFYPRRTAKDSELDPHKTIAEQFNLLRVVDNEKYPAYFLHQGQKYILKIYKQGSDNV